MPKICVEIEIDEDGTISVGQEPEGEDQAQGEGGEEAEKSYLQPVRSLDEALAKARQLLEQGGQSPAQAQEEAGFNQGFAQQAPQSIVGQQG